MSKVPGAVALSSVFSTQRKPREDDERLLDLYWNRAQLKKEYAAMRKERFKLLDSLTEQEGKNARLKQRLEYLEDLLTEPDTAGNSIAYYTLRKLWRANSARLVALSRELKKQQEATATQKLRHDWQARVDSETRSLKKSDASIILKAKGLNNERNMLSVELSEATGILNVIKRRRLREDMQAVLASLSEAEADLNAVRARLLELENEKSPEFERLDLRVRRHLNCTVLAMAHRLAVHYSSAGILDLVRTAQEKSVGSARFGSRKNCDVLVAKVHKLKDLFEQTENEKGFAVSLREEAAAIAKMAAFNKDDDAIPLPGSLNGMSLNVLAQDTWSVSAAMML